MTANGGTDPALCSRGFAPHRCWRLIPSDGSPDRRAAHGVDGVCGSRWQRFAIAAAALRRLVVTHLENLGYSVVSVADGEEALSVIESMESGDALLNEPFQRNDLALKVRTVLDA